MSNAACPKRNTTCPDCNVAPRVFGEALFACIECPKCGDFVMGVDIPDLKERWYRGERGIVERVKKEDA